jgi:hypothetical protein
MQHATFQIIITIDRFGCPASWPFTKESKSVASGLFII